MKLHLVTITALLLAAPLWGCSTGSDTTRADEQTRDERPAERPTEGEAGERHEEHHGDQMGDDRMGGEAGHPHPGGPMGQVSSEEMEEHCPMAVDDAEVSVEELEQGVAMRFTADDDEDVDELRQRVQWMAEHHNQMLEEMDPEQMRDPNGDEHGMMMHGDMMRMPEAHARAEQIEDGARIVFIARDDDNVEELQDHIAEHVEQMEEGACPMMYMRGASEDESG